MRVVVKAGQAAIIDAAAAIKTISFGGTLISALHFSIKLPQALKKQCRVTPYR